MDLFKIAVTKLVCSTFVFLVTVIGYTTKYAWFKYNQNGVEVHYGLYYGSVIVNGVSYSSDYNCNNGIKYCNQIIAAEHLGVSTLSLSLFSLVISGIIFVIIYLKYPGYLKYFAPISILTDLAYFSLALSAVLMLQAGVVSSSNGTAKASDFQLVEGPNLFIIGLVAAFVIDIPASILMYLNKPQASESDSQINSSLV